MKPINEQTRGMIFDVEEFAVFDGPGMRCAVFLKGCPLRCMWCHNPEGLNPRPERFIAHSLCSGCGRCKQVCPSPKVCTACGECVKNCPQGAIRICGEEKTAGEVAGRIRRHARILKANGGGVSFSGGEVLLQPEFVLAVRRLLPDVHALMETSGYGTEEAFRALCREMDMVIMDVKLADPQTHRRYTGKSNRRILSNLQILLQMEKKARIRVPLIPTVTDTKENMEQIAALLEGAGNLEKVELLRYHRAAGAKYAGLGKTYAPTFPQEKEPEIHMEPFQKRGIPVETL